MSVQICDELVSHVTGVKSGKGRNAKYPRSSIHLFIVYVDEDLLCSFPFSKAGLLLLTAFKVGMRVANGPSNGVEGKALRLCGEL